MINFNETKQPTLCVGKEKATMPFNYTFTLDAWEHVEGKNGEYVVYTAREFPGKYFNGGKRITEICTMLEAQPDEMASVINGEYRFQLVQLRTKNGFLFNNVVQIFG